MESNFKMLYRCIKCRRTTETPLIQYDIVYFRGEKQKVAHKTCPSCGNSVRRIQRELVEFQ